MAMNLHVNGSIRTVAGRPGGWRTSVRATARPVTAATRRATPTASAAVARAAVAVSGSGFGHTCAQNRPDGHGVAGQPMTSGASRPNRHGRPGKSNTRSCRGSLPTVQPPAP